MADPDQQTAQGEAGRRLGESENGQTEKGDGAKAGEGLARAQAVEQYAGGNLGDGRAQIHGATDEADLSGGQAPHLLEMNGQNGAALTVDLHHREPRAGQRRTVGQVDIVELVERRRHHPRARDISRVVPNPA